MALTIDPNNPDLIHGVDKEPAPQAKVYLVLSVEERAKGFVRPVRKSYRHTVCGGVTSMELALAETFARDNKFYWATYCTVCSKHLPVDEFVWEPDGSIVGS